MVPQAQHGRPRLDAARRALLGAAFSLLLAGLGGCLRYVETYSLSFRGRNGAVLASGEIDLTSPLPATGSIRGHYTMKLRPILVPDRDMEAFFQTFKGNESGRLEWTLGAPGRDPAKLDFIPTAVESDVVVTVYQRARGYWSGRWKYNNLTGSYDGGSVDISLRAMPSAPSGHN